LPIDIKSNYFLEINIDNLSIFRFDFSKDFINIFQTLTRIIEGDNIDQLYKGLIENLDNDTDHFYINRVYKILSETNTNDIEIFEKEFNKLNKELEFMNEYYNFFYQHTKEYIDYNDLNQIFLK
jgi:hypothetical protein